MKQRSPKLELTATFDFIGGKKAFRKMANYDSTQCKVITFQQIDSHPSRGKSIKTPPIF